MKTPYESLSVAVTDSWVFDPDESFKSIAKSSATDGNLHFDSNTLERYINFGGYNGVQGKRFESGNIQFTVYPASRSTNCWIFKPYGFLLISGSELISRKPALKTPKEETIPYSCVDKDALFVVRNDSNKLIALNKHTFDITVKEDLYKYYTDAVVHRADTKLRKEISTRYWDLYNRIELTHAISPFSLDFMRDIKEWEWARDVTSEIDTALEKGYFEFFDYLEDNQFLLWLTQAKESGNLFNSYGRSISGYLRRVVEKIEGIVKEAHKARKAHPHDYFIMEDE